MAACGLHIAIHKTREQARKLRDLISPDAKAVAPPTQDFDEETK
jgi:hypothetical protein